MTIPECQIKPFTAIDAIPKRSKHEQMNIVKFEMQKRERERERPCQLQNQ